MTTATFVLLFNFLAFMTGIGSGMISHRQEPSLIGRFITKWAIGFAVAVLVGVLVLVASVAQLEKDERAYAGEAIVFSPFLFAILGAAPVALGCMAGTALRSLWKRESQAS